MKKLISFLFFATAAFSLSARENNCTGKPKAQIGVSAQNQLSEHLRASQLNNITSGQDLLFMENKGQVTDQFSKPRTDVDFSLKASAGLNIFIGNCFIHYQFSKCDKAQASKPSKSRLSIPGLHSEDPENGEADHSTYTMYRMDVQLIGANKNAKLITEQEQGYYENYFTAAVGEKGATAHSYKRIIYKDIYPKIDWVLYTGGTQLKHEFVVREGGRVSDIKLKYGGATKLSLATDGRLEAQTPMGNITEQAPYSYTAGKEQVVCSFNLQNNEVSYNVADYTGTLTIDPGLTWGTYFGGSGDDQALGMGLDGSGNIYIDGFTSSVSGIATTGAYHTVYGGSTDDAFLAKFNSSGAIQWATYFGGSGDDVAFSIAIDGSGNVYIDGSTGSSSGIATSGVYQTTYGGGAYDAFLAKFTSAGSLVWATYIGGNVIEQGYGLAIDGSGNVYMTGETDGTSGIATSGAHQTAYGGGIEDAFLAKFSSAGSLIWGTYYGGSGTDMGYGIAIDGTGNVFMSGATSSTSAIATSGSYQSTYGGGAFNAFLSKFSSAGILQWATYYGGTGDDGAMQMAIDASGYIYITGYASSTAGIATSGAYQTVFGGGQDGFLAKFSSTGALQWGTYYGGSGFDQANGIALAGTGNVYITGYTATTTGMTTSGSYQPAFGGGGSDAFLADFNSTGALNWATYYGGSGNDAANGVAIGSTGALYLYGSTSSTSGIASSGAYQAAFAGGSYDAFLSNLPSPPITGPASVCVGSTITLTGSPIGGTWTSSNTAIGTVGSLTGVVTGVAAGVDTISYTTSGGTVTMAITVNPVPATMTGSNTVCGGYWAGCTTESDATPGGIWSISDPSIASMGSSSGTICGISAGIVHVTYTLTSTGCYVTKQMTVDPLIDYIVCPSLCVGGTGTCISYFPGGPSARWSSGNTAIATIDSTTGVATGVAAGIAPITYTLPMPGCRGTAPITVNPLPLPIAGLNKVCVGSNITLTDPSPGGTWTASNSNASVGSLSGTVTGVTAGLDTILYTTITGCSASKTITVTPMPAPISGAAGVCLGATTTLTDATPGGSWSSSNTAIATIGSGSGVVTGVSIGCVTITYTVGSCYATFPLCTNPLPSICTVTGGGSYCTGGSGIHIGLSCSSTGINYQLYNGASPVGSTIAGTGSALDFGLQTAAGTYTVVATNATTGCSRTMTGTAVIAINPLPAAIAGPSAVCVGSSMTLTSTPTGGIWTSSASAIASIGSSSGTVSGITAGVVTITYTLPTGCFVTTSITSGPGSCPITGSLSICAGASATLSNCYTGGIWSSSSPSVGSIGSLSGTVTAILTGTTLITYSLGTGCNQTATVTVTPSPAAIGGPSTTCVGSTITLSDATTGGSWSSSSTAIATVSGIGVVTGIGVGTAVITYLMPGGCFAAKTVTVNYAPGPINGPAALCSADCVTETDTVAGGTWSSSVPTVASVGSLSGIVCALTPGVTIITYSLGGSCFVTKSVTVNPMPSPITGVTTVCIGLTAALNDISPGGTWSSSNTSVAAIGTSGIVTGIAIGTSLISYTLGTGCVVTTTVSVVAAPVAIAGPSAICHPGCVTETDATTGGTWTSGSVGIATIGSSSGYLCSTAIGVTNITYTISSGCYATKPVTVAAGPLPISGPLSVCVGQTVAYTDAIGGGAWSSGMPGIAMIGSSTGMLTGVASGTVIISYTIIATGCTEVMAVVVNPFSPISGTPVVCVGQTTTLTNSTLGGTWISGSSAIATVSPGGVVTGISAGTTTIDYLTTGCVASVIVTVNPLPLPVSGPSFVCIGHTIPLTDASPSGTWSSSNPGIGSVDGVGNVTGISSGTTLISFTFPGTTGCSATKSVTVNPAPSPISGPAIVCLGSAITLTDAGGGTWISSDPTIASIGSASGIVSGIALGTVTINYLVGTGCFTTKLVTVVNAPLPIAGTFTVCQGASSVLTDPSGAGTWTSSNIFVATIGSSTGLLTGVNAGSAVVTFSTGPGCYATHTVNVNNLPVLISGSTSLCYGNTSTFSATGIGTWSSGDTTVAIVGATSGIVTAVATGVSILTYTLSTGCSLTVLVTVGANPLPITGINRVCIGTATTLSDPAPGGIWSSSTPGIASVSPSGVVTGDSLGTVSIFYSVSGYPCPARMTVSVNPLPAAISGSPYICISSTTTLSDAIPGGVWSSSDITTATIGSSSGIVAGVATGPVTITYAMGAGCFTTKAMTVNPMPLSISGPGTVCQLQSITLSDPTPGGTWSSSSPAIGTVDLVGDVTGINTGVVTISYTTGLGCASAYSVTVNTAPSSITGSIVCIGSTATLTDAVSGGTWSSTIPANATIGSSSGIVTGVALGTTTIIYTLPAGCMATTLVTVNPLPAIFTVTGGGNRCATDSGVHIGLSGSGLGANYLLYHGSTAIGSFPGTGSALDFGLLTVAGTYTVTATSTITGCSAAMSGIAAIAILPTVVPSVGMSVSPNDTVCAGATVTFTPVPLNGGSSPVYGWTVNSFPVTSGTTYTYIPANGDLVKVTMTSNAMCPSPAQVNDSVRMTVLPHINPSVSIASNPGDTLCQGSLIILNALPVYGGSSPLFSWLKNGAPSGTGNFYSFVPNNGDLVYCIINSSYPCRLQNADTSGPLVITTDTPVIPAIFIAANPGTTVKPGQYDTLIAIVTGATAPTYQWYINSIPVAGATTGTYISNSFSSPVDDSISVVVYSHDVCETKAHQWVYITIADGVRQISAEGGISVLPNPNSGDFTISGSLATNLPVNIELTDMLGKLIYRDVTTIKNGKFNKIISLDDHVSNGCYLLRLINEDINQVLRISINR